MKNIDNPPPQAGRMFEDDTRNLLMQHCRRSPAAFNSPSRVRQHGQQRTTPSKYLKDHDPSCRNQWLVDFSTTVTCAAYGAQNNIQVVSPDGLGAVNYIADYLSKGDGTRLTNCLPCLHEAVAVSAERPSNAPDADTNELRPAMRTLIRMINNQYRSSEFSVRLCLSHLLSMQQFESSHEFRFVYAHSAREGIQKSINSLMGKNDSPADATLTAARAQNEENEDEAGDLLITMVDGRSNLGVVTQWTDYRHRGEAFRNYCLLEFVCLVKKKPLQQDQAQPAGGVQPDDDYEEDANADNVDISLSAPLSTESESTQRPKAGRRANGVFSLDSPHPQSATHRLHIVSKVFLPILAGKYVPKFPGEIPPLNAKELEKWKKAADEFGSYFLCLMCPCSLVTGIPVNMDTGQAYELSWNGFREWMAAAELKDGKNSFCPQYVQNCIYAQESRDSLRKCGTLLRTRKADTKEDYEASLERKNKGDQYDCGFVENASQKRTYGEKPRQNRRDRVAMIINCLREQYETIASNEVASNGHMTLAAKQMERDQLTVNSLMTLFHGQPLAGADENNYLALQSSRFSSLSYLQAANVRMTTKEVTARLETLSSYSVLHTDQEKHRQMSANERRAGAVYNHAGSAESSASSREAPSEHPAEPNFSATQRKLFERFRQGLSSSNESENSVCQMLELLLGMPGTGKTFVSNSIRALLRPRESLVAAPTGKAATQHDGGQTIQGLFGLGIDTKALAKLQKGSLMRLAAVTSELKLLILDEVSMMSASLLEMVNQRLKEVRSACNKLKNPGSSNNAFGGVHVLMLGDFQQLEPVCSASLMEAALDTDANKQTKAGNSGFYFLSGQLFRQFHLTHLIEQKRSVDPFHTQMLQMLSNPIANAKPITEEFLKSVCQNCMGPTGQRLLDPQDHEASDEALCPPRCPHRCQHLKELMREEVVRDPEWKEAKYVAPLNSTVDAWTTQALKRYAESTRQPIIRWMLPSSASSAADLQSFYNTPVLRQKLESISDIWGYYVKGAPVLLTMNINPTIGIAHGTAGVLHSIVFSTESEDDDERQIVLNGIREARPGTIIHLASPPLAINVQMPGLRHPELVPRSALDEGEAHPILSLPQKGGLCGTKRGYREVDLIKRHDDSLPALRVLEPGYTLNFASTVHKVQGDTIGKMVVDLNYNPKSGQLLNLPSMYVILSRVKRAADLRVAPWIPKLGKDHLKKLCHNPLYSRYLSAYNEQGDFEVARIPPPPPAPPQKAKQLPRSKIAHKPGQSASSTILRNPITGQNITSNGGEQPETCSNNHFNPVQGSDRALRLAKLGRKKGTAVASVPEASGMPLRGELIDF